MRGYGDSVNGDGCARESTLSRAYSVGVRVCAIAEAGLSLNCTHTTQTATSPRRGHRPEPLSRERLPEDSCAGMVRKNGIQWVRVCTFGSGLLPRLKRLARVDAEQTEAANRESQRLKSALEKERSQFVVAAKSKSKTSRAA